MMPPPPVSVRADPEVTTPLSRPRPRPYLPPNRPPAPTPPAPSLIPTSPFSSGDDGVGVAGPKDAAPPRMAAPLRPHPPHALRGIGSGGAGQPAHTMSALLRSTRAHI